MAERSKRKQEQEKVLRIGIVQGGKVVHERLIRHGQSVTVGESPKNTFVFPAKGLPKRFTLLQAKGSRYSLNFNDKMSGKVGHRGEVVGLMQLRKSGAASRKGASWTLPLTPKTRGKLEIDGVTVLFQFVSAPPESARMVHRQDYRPKLLEEDDPVFLGFLALWSAVATVFMIYALGTEPVDLVPLEAIPDRFVEIVMPERQDKEKEDLPTLEDDSAKAKEVVKKEETAEKKPGKKKDKKPLTEAEKQQREAARIQKKKENLAKKSKLLAGLIGTRGETNSGQTVEDVFAEGDSKIQSLQDALQDVGGVGVAGEDSLAMRGQTEGGGRADASIGDLAKGGGGDSEVGTVATKAPTGKASMGTAEIASGEDADEIRRVLKKYSAQVKYCYEGRLKENPNIAGRVAVDVDIANGRVTSVVVSENTTNDKALGDCIRGKVRRWRFPAGVSDSIYLPFALSPS